MKKYSILFVCADNHCRSPMAAGVMCERIADLGLQDLVEVDSAGTHDYNVEEPTDIRAQKHATRRGYDLSALRARLVQLDDFERFDLILAMDDSNFQTLQMRCPPEHRGKLQSFREFLGAQETQDVLDPYYGDTMDFEHVLDQIEDGCDRIAAMVSQKFS